MGVSFIWFDMGYTLVYMQREATYQQALEKSGINVSIEILEKEFHLMDKLFMREYPGVFLNERGVYMPWYLGALNYRLGIRLDVCELDTVWHGIQMEVENYWLPFDGVHKVLKALKKDSFGLGIISNWDDTARNVLNGTELSEVAARQRWFRQREFRRAVSEAIDREAIKRLVYQGRATIVATRRSNNSHTTFTQRVRPNRNRPYVST